MFMSSEGQIGCHNHLGRHHYTVGFIVVQRVDRTVGFNPVECLAVDDVAVMTRPSDAPPAALDLVTLHPDQFNICSQQRRVRSHLVTNGTVPERKIENNVDTDARKLRPERYKVIRDAVHQR